ncbi:unnamed protein product [Medioppia subpectinata]|uniref:BZIP domain-containing protein n=1 Tax=Medioppia subpectinata TaxID=1979941 RepID=A0A7R9Q1S0_9ACAR|nr:unnamed protein product [Medioppia subpectinata]CAG2108657.1 unnamed protein product [Medioppia subpectinata]
MCQTSDGSDCSDTTTPSEDTSLPDQSLHQELISRRVIESDHSYDTQRVVVKTTTSDNIYRNTGAIEGHKSTANTTTTTAPNIDQYFSLFDPLMECLDSELFGGDLRTMAYEELDDLAYANAPTPFMAPMDDLQGIDAEDLFNYDTNTMAATDGNNNPSEIDFNNIFSDNEVTVVDTNSTPIAAPVVAAVTAPFTATAAGRQAIVIKQESMDYESSRDRVSRKRHISYPESPYVDEEDDDNSSGDESVAPAKGKAKVGRKPSKGGDKCMSRNAIAARENREKKKRESEDMKRRLNAAVTDNKALKADNEKMCRELKESNAENEYLRAIIANSTPIAAFIKHITNAPSVELIGTHFVAATNGTDSSSAKMAALVDDKNQRKSSRIAAKVVDTAGICLHMNNNKVSLELCHKCSDASKKHRKGK